VELHRFRRGQGKVICKTQLKIRNLTVISVINEKIRGKSIKNCQTVIFSEILQARGMLNCNFYESNLKFDENIENSFEF
jgi:hypothetical protein